MGPGMNFIDIPGSMDASDAAELAELCRGKRVLQVGAYCGRASVVIAQTCERLYVYDNFRAYSWHDVVMEELIENLEEAGAADKVEALFSTVPPEVDVVYFDADWTGDVGAAMSEMKTRYPNATVCAAAR